jgi:hypothetical protein
MSVALMSKISDTNRSDLRKEIKERRGEEEV